MPTSYRYEVAKQGRAGCQNSACKKDNVKIAKGELRFGTLVQIPNFGDSWKWKHWGCVTPQQIANIIDQLGGLDGLDVNEDLDILDGYDELPDWAQKKIRDALTNGHVDDEDWKGEPELNRPGQKGINKRTPKKKRAGDGESGTSETEDSPVKPKKVGRKKKQASSDVEEEESGPRKKATSKKRKSKEDSDDEAEAPPPKKRAAKNKKAAVKSKDIDSDSPAPEPTKKKVSRAKKETLKEEAAEETTSATSKKKSRAKKVQPDSNGAADAGANGEFAVPQSEGMTETKAGNKPAPKKGGKRAAVADDDLQNQDDSTPAASKPTKAGRGKKAKTETSAETVTTDPSSKPSKARQSKSAKTIADKEEDEVLDASDKKKQARRGRGKKGGTAVVPEDEQTAAVQPQEPAAAISDTKMADASGGEVEVEADNADTTTTKDKKKGRLGRSARRSNSKSEKA